MNENSEAAQKKGEASGRSRLAPHLLFVTGLCLLVFCWYNAGYGALPPTEKRYAAAKESTERLKLDEKRAGQRAPWEQLAGEFQAIYQNDPDWPNRPAALFRAAETLEELARRSFNKADARRAAECFEQVAQRHADSRLADDALFRAAQLRAGWLKDDRSALALIAKLRKQYPRGDMLPQALALEKTLQASAEGRTAPEAARQAARTVASRIDVDASGTAVKGTVQAQKQKPAAAGPAPTQDQAARYRDAKARMDALRADRTKSAQRRPWELMRDDFLAVGAAGSHPTFTPAALFRAAECQEILARIAALSGEHRRAVAMYLAVPREHPASPLADDALLAAARIQADGLGNTKAALGLIQRQLAEHPGGDMRADALALRDRLTAPKGGRPAATAQAAPAASPARQAAAAPAQAGRRRAPEVQMLSWDSTGKDSVEIVLELSGPAAHDSRIVREGKNPPAVILELAGASVTPEVRRGVTVRGSLLQSVRVQKGKNGSELRFDFRDLARHEVRVLRNPYRVVLSAAAGSAELPRNAGVGTAYAEQDLPSTRVSHKVRQAGRADLVSQLGLSVHRVILDAGHGGRDPGTVHNNVVERAITLDVVLTLGRLLGNNGLEVIYTRDTDRYITLSDRTNKANAVKADLFVSVHVNASPNTLARGFETYFLDMASNSQAAHVAALENARSDRRIGDLQDILADVMLSARQEESRRLAIDIQRVSVFRLGRRGYQVRNNGTKSAPFHVLLGANMPAVLVELGYCSNVAEAARLRDPKYRLALAEGLAEGILAYRDRLLKRRTAQNNGLTERGPGAM